MKRKWIRFIDEKYGTIEYRCKICGIERMKKTNILWHCEINHTKWEKRDKQSKYEEGMIWNIDFDSSAFKRKYPNPKAINITWLFVEYNLKGFMNLIINYVCRGDLLS